MDITKRLQELQRRYGWTDYKIAKEAGLSPNTVSNIYRRGNTPSMVTLEEIRRRFNVVSVFPDRDSVVRLGGAILIEQNDEWSVDRLMHPDMRGQKVELQAETEVGKGH